MASVSRICSQQQSIFGNESISVHSKLWKRIKNGADIRKKGKVEKAMEFAEKMKKV